jgi:hypothetical protein
MMKLIALAVERRAVSSNDVMSVSIARYTALYSTRSIDDLLSAFSIFPTLSVLCMYYCQSHIKGAW